MISKFENFILSERDDNLLRVNPHKYGAERNMEEQEALDLFLHSANLGIFQLNWDLVCPTCGDIVHDFKSLKAINTHFHCTICDIHKEAALDDYIQISFTVSPLVRDIIYHHPEELSPTDFMLKYHFSKEAVQSSGEPVSEFFKRISIEHDRLMPGESKSFSYTFEEGYLKTYEFLTQDANLIVFSKDAPEIKHIDVKFKDGSTTFSAMQVKTGNITFTISNDGSKVIFYFLGFLSMNEEPLRIKLLNILTGKRILTSQTFRDLFRTEIIEGEDGISIKDLTFLFTDLKGSTELYERIGDLRAFNLVGSILIALVRWSDVIMAPLLKP